MNICVVYIFGYYAAMKIHAQDFCGHKFSFLLVYA